MNARDQIISAIAKAGVPDVPLPVYRHEEINGKVEGFIAAATENGSSAIRISARGLEEFINERFADRSLASEIVRSTVTVNAATPLTIVANIDVAVIKGEFAVAENGAVKIQEVRMLNRALPFLCENLVLVVDENSILDSMHSACAQAPTSDYCVFISGPSKTADIEQSLVIGVHGPKTLTIAILTASL